MKTMAWGSWFGRGLVAGLAAALLSGCFPLVVGGAMVGGAMVATDRRTSGTQLEDEGIELKAMAQVREQVGERVHVNVNAYNRRVLITGEVPSLQDKALVERLVSRVDNVLVVINELAVLGPSTLGQRSSDALVTSRVKAGLVDAQDLSANAFKVTTERGEVYLMGRVTARESQRATDVARTTSGVQKVVRVFEIITEEELRALMPQAPADKAAATKG